MNISFSISKVYIIQCLLIKQASWATVDVRLTDESRIDEWYFYFYQTVSSFAFSKVKI